jgi:hypothetical protein
MLPTSDKVLAKAEGVAGIIDELTHKVRFHRFAP